MGKFHAFAVGFWLWYKIGFGRILRAIRVFGFSEKTYSQIWRSSFPFSCFVPSAKSVITQKKVMGENWAIWSGEPNITFASIIQSKISFQKRLFYSCDAYAYFAGVKTLKKIRLSQLSPLPKPNSIKTKNFLFYWFQKIRKSNATILCDLLIAGRSSLPRIPKRFCLEQKLVPKLER